MAVYLDCAATTPVDPRVRDAVLRALADDVGNAGSRTHAFGQQARRIVEQARQQVAAVVGASRGDVLFTSGATESNNLAILGIAAAHADAAARAAASTTATATASATATATATAHARDEGVRRAMAGPRGHVVTTAIEHHAVLEPIRELERRGVRVTVVAPGPGGWVDARAVLGAIEPDTMLVSVMHVNNETGVVQPIESIAEGLAERGLACAFHVDAAQGFGKDLEPLRHPRIDLISVSGHKIGAPMGVGALIARRGPRNGRAAHAHPAPAPAAEARPTLAPLTFGGGQERGLRPGTLPVPLILGLGLAAELAVAEHDQRQARCRAFRERLLTGLAPLAPVLNGDPARTLPHIVNLAIPGVEAEAAMEAWRDLVAISNGAACTSQSYTCSHVLSAMRVDPHHAEGALRLSWTHDSALPDLPAMVAAIVALVPAALAPPIGAPRVGAHVA